MGQDDLDQIEEDLRRCQEDFARAVTPFGIAGSDPRALDQLIEREAGQRIQGSELDNLRKQLKQFAPQGLEPLHNKVVALQAQLQDALARGPAEGEALPAEPTELDALAASLQQHLLAQEIEIKRLESADAQAEKRLQAERKGELAAKEELAERKTKARASREELDRLRTEQQITERVQQAERALEASQAQLLDTELTSDERTIDERLKEAQEAAGALQSQIGENTRKHDVIKGRLLESEGLHAQRASLAARVDELTRITAREMLERDAVDRLYALFEDCREKQLGTLMGPIHDRVLGWMRVLDIGDYQQVRFSDAFLPEKLLTRDGTAEFSLQEESTGAQEQIGMLTRLALGSILAAPGQPAVAILDDPLTHCDQARLHKMRLILRRAAEGDPSLNPPAGPLQIVILTCHPEWFRDERATVIDLESPEVMSRLDV
jgi:hypothetical protein